MGKNSPKNVPKKSDKTPKKSLPQKKEAAEIPMPSADCVKEDLKKMIDAASSLSLSVEKEKLRERQQKTQGNSEDSQENSDDVAKDVVEITEDGVKKYSCSIPAQLNVKTKYGQVIYGLVQLLQSEFYVSEHEKALATYDVLEYFIVEEHWNTTQQIVDRLMNFKQEVFLKFPCETTPENVIRRVKKLIVDEYLTGGQFKSLPHSTRNILSSITQMNVVTDGLPEDVILDCDPEELAEKIRKPVIISLREYKNELDNVDHMFRLVASQFITDGDNILTFSYCRHIEAMVRAVTDQGARVTIHALETAPWSYAYLYVDAFEDSSNVTVVVVPDCFIGGVVPNVNKLLVPCLAVLPNLEAKTMSNGYNVLAMAERLHTIAVAPSFTFSTSVEARKNRKEQHTVRNKTWNVWRYDIVSLSTTASIVTNLQILSLQQAHKMVTDLYTPKREKEEPYEVQVGPGKLILQQ